MAFAAETGTIPVVAWWLLAVNIVWSVIYDTLYAMVDRDDDIAVGIKSTAILFGRKDLLILRILKLLMLLLLIRVGLMLELGLPWNAAIGITALLFGLQQYWVRNREPAASFKAFLNHNWVGLVLFVGLLGHYWTN